jgi:hypothetical protein
MVCLGNCSRLRRIQSSRPVPSANLVQRRLRPCFRLGCESGLANLSSDTLFSRDVSPALMSEHVEGSGNTHYNFIKVLIIWLEWRDVTAEVPCHVYRFKELQVCLLGIISWQALFPQRLANIEWIIAEMFLPTKCRKCCVSYNY